MAQSVINSDAIARGFDALARAFVPNANAMIQADLARGRRDLMREQALSEPARRALMEAQAAQAMAQAGLLSQQEADLVATRAARIAERESIAAKNNADAEYRGAETERYRQGTEGRQQLSDVFTGEGFDPANPNDRARLAGAAALTPDGLGGAMPGVVAGSVFVNPNYQSPTDIGTAMVAAGNVGDYSHTPGGFYADQARQARETAAANENALAIQRAANEGAVANTMAGADADIRRHEAGIGVRGASTPKTYTLSPMETQRLNNMITEALVGEKGRFEGHVLAPGVLTELAGQVGEVYSRTGNLAGAVADVLSGAALQSERYDPWGPFNAEDRVVLTPGAQPAQPAQQTQPAQPAPDAQPAQPAPAAQPVVDPARLQALQPGERADFGGVIVGKNSAGHPYLWDGKQWVPLQ